MPVHHGRFAPARRFLSKSKGLPKDGPTRGQRRLAGFDLASADAGLITGIKPMEPAPPPKSVHEPSLALLQSNTSPRAPDRSAADDSCAASHSPADRLRNSPHFNASAEVKRDAFYHSCCCHSLRGVALLHLTPTQHRV